ncbi:MAG: hypothetical protein EB038_02560, partial [Cyclobacteriaceae bacterium]|nr:hypothetical protein [Cyclobacteriaceae bacterium]
MPIKCTIPENILQLFFEDFLNANPNIPDNIELDPSDGLARNLLIISQEHIVQNNISKYICNFIDTLLKEKNVMKVCELVRVSGYKILHFNVPLERIMKITISHLATIKKAKQYISDIISISANLQHKSLTVSKHIIVFEKYFLDIYKTV